MKEIDFIARNTIIRISEFFESKGKTLLRINSRLAEFMRDLNNASCAHVWQEDSVTAKRYRRLTEEILEGDKAAGNVLAMSLALVLCPDFAVELHRITLYEVTVRNGWRVEGIELPDYEVMKKSYNRLVKIFLINGNAFPFFDVPFYVDNRLLGYLCGEDVFDAQTVPFCDLFLADRDGTKYDSQPRGEIAAIRQIMEQGKSIQLRSDDAKDGGRDLLKECAVSIGRNLIFVNLHYIKQEKYSELIFRIAREALFYQSYVCFLGLEESILKGLKLSLHQFYDIFAIPLFKMQIPICFCTGEDIRMQTVAKAEITMCRAAKRGSFAVKQGTLVGPIAEMTPEAIVTSERNKMILKKICNHWQFAKRVYEDFDMGKQYPYGRGVCALFAGSPGTGKTMAAYVVSNMLKLPLYHVDLSQIADKYIGETEKHLEEVFRYAEQNQVILFFDEADSVFGKRTEVKEAKDHYANTAVSYILQRIEQYEGIVILATNLKGNMDTAFMRRVTYTAHFAMPDEKMRMEIWKRGFSKSVPTEQIDFSYLARQFELSGGNIKNIILAAVFDAAGQNCPVNMGHILEAIANEYAKYNKTVTPEEFGEYEALWRERLYHL